MNSIYSQLGSALKQTAKVGQRSILWRGKVIECVVLLGVTDTKLSPGGLETMAVVHLKVPRDLVPIGSDGEPHTNERIKFPAVPANNLVPADYIIKEVIAEEYDYAITLTDPSA